MTDKYLENARVVSNRNVAPDFWTLRLAAPHLASIALPGQFVLVQLGDSGRPLRRPMSIYQADANRGEIRLLYQAVGAGTRLMTTWLADRRVSVLGPLGTTWPILPEARRILLIGGGIGTAPLAMLAQQLQINPGIQVTMIQAAQSAERLVGRDFFEPLVDTWICATDDGSAGVKGLVTVPLEDKLSSEEFDVAYVCGPEVMLVATAAICARHKLKCYVSLERRMACGLGACLGCVITTKTGLQKVCQTGPVFDAEEVCWDENIASRVH